MAGGPKEIELKLECGAAGLEALATHPLLATATEKTEARLASTYYDTRDFRLRLAGATLRVRSVDDADFRQTVKTRGDGLFERGEWEHRLAGSQPSFEALAETPASGLLGQDPELAAVFMTSIERRTFVVEHDGATVEVALDRGRVTAPAGGARDDVSEVELELKGGSAKGLFALARHLGEIAELKLGVSSKSDRGHALAAGEPDEPSTAEPVHLTEDMTASEALRSIAHGALRQIRLNEDLVVVRPDVEALHQLRIGVRRLRSAFSLYGGLVDDPAFEALKDELKRLSDPFGRARDLDVFLGETMPEQVARRPDASLLNLEKRLEARRPGLRRAVLKTLRSKEWRTLLIDIVGWLNSGAWLEPKDEKTAMGLGQPARSFAAGELERRLRQVKRRGRALDKISAEERHKVRIAAKKLRYGAEFFGSLFDGGKRAKRHDAFVKELKKLQGGLGSLNDIATAQALVRDLAGEEGTGLSTAFAAGMTAADIDRTSKDLLKDARTARKRLLQLRPFWR